MKRSQQVLIGVLALQIVLSVVVFWPREVASVSGEAIFPDLAPEDIVALSIEDTTGTQIVLRKQDDAAGVGWVMPEADDYPLDETKVTPALEKLAALSASSVVAQTEASHVQLEVAESAFQRRLEFETAAGETHTVFLGSAPRYTATHFRVQGQSETYLTSDLSVWDVNVAVSSWADTSYVQIDQETVTQVTLENANGTFTFVKDAADGASADPASAGTWGLVDLGEDEESDTSQISAVVRTATQLSLKAPLGTTEDPAWGLATPGAVATVTTEDGQTHTLVVGGEPQEDADGASADYVVKSSDSEYYVLVASFNVTSLLERSREDFVTEPPTPTGVSPATPTAGPTQSPAP